MWKIAKGQKIRNVKVAENEYKNFYEGEFLPSDYEPHPSYIQCGIVEKIEQGGRHVKNR